MVVYEGFGSPARTLIKHSFDIRSEGYIRYENKAATRKGDGLFCLSDVARIRRGGGEAQDQQNRGGA